MLILLLWLSSVQMKIDYKSSGYTVNGKALRLRGAFFVLKN